MKKYIKTSTNSKTKKHEVTVKELRRNGIMVLDKAQFYKLVFDIANMRDDEVLIDFPTDNIEDAYYEGTLKEAEKVLDDEEY